MGNVLYYITGPSLQEEYGIAAVDRSAGHNAVTMHFVKNRADAERLVKRLNELQTPISDFCEAFSDGILIQIV